MLLAQSLNSKLINGICVYSFIEIQNNIQSRFECLRAYAIEMEQLCPFFRVTELAGSKMDLKQSIDKFVYILLVNIKQLYKVAFLMHILGKLWRRSLLYFLLYICFYCDNFCYFLGRYSTGQLCIYSHPLDCFYLWK